jgi:hypothetical protein
MANGAQIFGAKELERTFKTLGDRVQRKVLKQAVNAGATPVLKTARQKALRRSGILSKSLGKKVISDSRTQTATALVGARKGITGEVDGKIEDPSRISHLVEKGHITASGSFVRPYPFLGPAEQESKGQALDAVKSKLADGVVREAMKGST